MKHTCGAHTVAPSFLFLEKLNENQMKQQGQWGVGRLVMGGDVNNTTLPRPRPSPPPKIKQNERISIVTMENLSNKIK
jgi:hypothetical protein